MKDSFFADKVAVITGGGGVLCSAMARHLAQLGVKVAIVGRTKEKLDGVASEIRSSGGTAMVVPADVTDHDRLVQARGEIRDRIGACSFLINGAGGNQDGAVTSVSAFVREELDPDRESDLRGFFNLDMSACARVVQVNTLGTMIPCQVFGEDMAGSEGGAIVNIASVTSYRPLSRVPAYAAAKAGVLNFTQWLAAYLAPAGIRVNAIAPGFFLTPRNSRILLDPDGDYSVRGKSILRQTPFGRFGQAEELLGCVRWLLDERVSGFVTGVTVPVDGGFLSCPGI